MALKSTIAAALVAFSLSLLPGTAAEAKTTVHVAIGTGGGWVAGTCWDRYGRRCGWRAHPRYLYAPYHRPGVYLYAPRRYPGVYYDFSYRYGRPYRVPVSARMSCAAARNLVDNRGFNSVRARDCRGSVYTFKARRHGRNFLVRVNAHSRRIIGVGGI